MDGVPEELAREAFKLAAAPPFKRNFWKSYKTGDVMKAKELREKSVEELNTELLNLLREQFKLLTRLQVASCNSLTRQSKCVAMSHALRLY